MQVQEYVQGNEMAKSKRIEEEAAFYGMRRAEGDSKSEDSGNETSTEKRKRGLW